MERFIRLSRPLTPEWEQQSGWQLCFWTVGERASLRGMLAQVAQLLGLDPSTSMRLPPFEHNEDFVEGDLYFNGQLFRVYYEYPLEHLCLASESKDAVLALARRLEPHVIII